MPQCVADPHGSCAPAIVEHELAVLDALGTSLCRNLSHWTPSFVDIGAPTGLPLSALHSGFRAVRTP
jgi:hypothetical protein